MMSLRGATGQIRKNDIAGHWRVIAHPPGRSARDITYVRGVPTVIGSMSDTDPFGAEQATLTFSKITLFDRLGIGDLDWMIGNVSIDIVFEGELPPGYPDGGFVWQGFAPSFDPSNAGTSVTLTGSLRQLDNYLAKPEYVSRPIPYEWAIARQWDGKPDLRVSRLRVEWPSWWTNRYVADPKAPTYMIPTGVRPGDKWTGLVTRSTGKWEPVLSTYINTLLAGMYTDRGRWTIDLAPGRVPILRHRDFRYAPDNSTLVVDLASPGVDASLSIDWSQTLNVAYGQGTSLAGVAYSGMEVSPDGLATSYRPLAALRQVHPPSDRNGWLQKSRMRKEVMLEMQAGLDASDAATVAQAHLEHFADPGITGTVALTVDPEFAGEALPRFLIKAGMNLQLKGCFSNPDGVVVHIAKVVRDMEQGSVQLTVDSKYRDQLTVDEVRLRGRDALSISRALIGGQFTPVVPDQLLPWNYGEGSGYIPGGKEYSSLRLFTGMPRDVEFPWTDWTVQRPPKAAAWKHCYIRIGPASSNADKNWSGVANKGGGLLGFPIKMAQAGQIRLIQIAAYDKNGNVLKVPFHFSLYYSNGVNFSSMPRIPAGITAPYPAGQHYPFFDGAWETYYDDGRRVGTELPNATDSVRLLRGWGTINQKAGYWPGSSTTGDLPTGLLVDESVFDFDCTRDSNTFDPYNPGRNASNPLAGMIYAMIYCDAQGDQEVFFAGRMFRVEPGTTTN